MRLTVEASLSSTVSELVVSQRTEPRGVESPDRCDSSSV